MRKRHPLQKNGLAARLLPAAAATIIAFAVVPLATTVDMHLALLALMVLGLMVFIIAFVPWERIWRPLYMVVPLLYVVMVVLLREATGGVMNVADYETLLIVPVVGVAVYGTRSELVFIITVIGLTWISAFQSGLDINNDGWVKVVLWISVASIIGFSIQRLVEEIEKRSLTDVLTGAANRDHWEQAMEATMQDAVQNSQPLCVAALDIDNLKQYNDRHGHHGGDKLISASAHHWQRELREGDLLARVGGDEFVAMLPNCNLLEAEEIGERLRKDMPYQQTISVGIAAWDRRESAESLLGRADRALYYAKNSGRDQVSSKVPLDYNPLS
jgi:diguanylate cyclase (GGDEF)-like protein